MGGGGVPCARAGPFGEHPNVGRGVSVAATGCNMPQAAAALNDLNLNSNSSGSRTGTALESMEQASRRKLKAGEGSLDSGSVSPERNPSSS